MLIKRIISTFLALLMLVSALSMVVSAEETSSDSGAIVYEYNTNKLTPTMDYINGKYELKDENGTIIDTVKVDTKQKKLETMDLRLEYEGYRLYVDAYSGEVAVENVVTGDVLFSNPYDLGTKSISEDDKADMLSQIIISFVDTSDNDDPDTYNSYVYAVRGGDDNLKDATAKLPASQIDVKYIKNGIRVEYQIGRTDSRYLVPKFITAETYDREFGDVQNNPNLSDFEKRQFLGFIKKRGLTEHLAQFKDEEMKEKNKEAYLEQYPFADMTDENGEYIVFYECTCAVKTEYAAVENIIKNYFPEYTFEDLDSEHLDLGVDPKEMNEPLFKISLEYTLDKEGLTVRVPANGIRFDESVYRLDDIEILPYMGAGSNPNSGYTFFPDGSGTLFDFEELAKLTVPTWFHGSIYGHDFTYSKINTQMPHNQVVRYPVFGLVEDETLEDGSERSRGFLAVIEEGESLMTLSAHHSTYYNTVHMVISPRPYDEYKLADAISVSTSGAFVVASPRKYTGDFRIRYTMLTDPDVKTGEGYYDTSYVGMAKAYREYLIKNGTLSKLTENDVKTDIPLYIETFGAIETTEKFMSIPYDTMKALTSFDDIKKMYDELSESNIKNINFILTGYNKGGLSVDQMPYHLNWDNSVEKEMKFEELLQYAKDNGFGLYPDFDFVFAADNKMFDGLSLMSHAAKTIDDRYTSKREYSASRQAYINYFELVMSPAYFSRFYEKLTKNYSKYEPMGISVSTMASYLNSDFDEDDPYHREDSKGFVIDSFKYFDEHYSKVMTSGGNAYSWKYVDYITDIATDSSRHARSAATVPFLGIVLHGYVQTAATPINMEGNTDYALLRAIENGSALKFILSYRNTSLLKENVDTSVYYSVRYDIWLDDVIANYSDINKALSDVQTSTIDVHQFIDGLRIPNADEIEGDSFNELFNFIYKDIQDSAAAKEELRALLQAVRKNLLDWKDYMTPEFQTAQKIYDTKAQKITDLTAANTAVNTAKTALAAAEKAIADLEKPITDAKAAVKTAEDALAKADENADKKALEDAVKAAQAALETAKTAAQKDLLDARKALDNAKTQYEEALADMFAKYYDYKDTSALAKETAAEYIEKYEIANDNFAKLSDAENDAYTADIIAGLKTILDDAKAPYEALKVLAKNMAEEKEADVILTIEKEYAEEIGVDVADKVEEEENANSSFNKYAVPANSIVYERYSNGKEFILNFNNYAVKVMLNNVYYTVDAYGYVIVD